MRNLFSNPKLLIKRSAPIILTFASVAGVIGTTVLAAKATPKAIKLLEKAENEKQEPLTVVEKVKFAGPAYIPTVVVGLSTVVCIVGINVLSKRQQAGITSAYALLNSSFKEYKKKVADIYGNEVEEKIREEVAKDNYKNVINENKNKKENTNANRVLFYDEFSKRYFESTIEKVQQAEYYLNRDLTMRDYAYLNEFYESLEIPGIDAGWTLGWSVGACLDMYWQNWIDFNHKRVKMDDGTECIHITIFQEPIIDFEDYS